MFQKSNKLNQIKVQGIEIILELNEKVFAPSENGLFYARALNIKKGDKVIDIGTGSGILAIFSAKKGAVVSATDIDSESIKLAGRNFELNKTEVELNQGSLFQGFNGPFDVIIANLPNEIIPSSYADHIGKQLSKTFNGGEKGNEFILALLNDAKRYMHRKSRLYLPVHTLTDYHEVLDKAIKHYDATLVALSELPVKSFVEENLAFYLKLNERGIIKVFKKDNSWYSYGYVYELSIKS